MSTFTLSTHYTPAGDQPKAIEALLKGVPPFTTIHNLFFIVSLIKNIREAILNDSYVHYKEDFLSRYR